MLDAVEEEEELGGEAVVEEAFGEGFPDADVSVLVSSVVLDDFAEGVLEDVSVGWLETRTMIVVEAEGNNAAVLLEDVSVGLLERRTVIVVEAKTDDAAVLLPLIKK